MDERVFNEMLLKLDAILKSINEQNEILRGLRQPPEESVKAGMEAAVSALGKMNLQDLVSRVGGGK